MVCTTLRVRAGWQSPPSRARSGTSVPECTARLGCRRDLPPLPDPVSDTFDPTRWRTVDGFEDLTDLTYHRGFARPTPDQCRRREPRTCPSSASRSTGPRCATRSGRTPSTSCTACSTTRARRPTSAPCCSPATARAPRTAAGRSAPAATSASAAGRRLPVRVGRDRAGRRPRTRRPPAHPRGPAPHPDHAEGRRRPGQRLGGRRRALAARRRRPHRSPAASTRASCRPTPTSARSTAATARRCWPGRWARSGPARSSSSPASTRRSRRSRGAR